MFYRRHIEKAGVEMVHNDSDGTQYEYVPVCESKQILEHSTKSYTGTLFIETVDIYSNRKIRTFTTDDWKNLESINWNKILIE